MKIDLKELLEELKSNSELGKELKRILQGPQGVRGYKGDLGPAGPPKKGRDGKDGRDGKPGRDGRDGKDGIVKIEDVRPILKEWFECWEIGATRKLNETIAYFETLIPKPKDGCDGARGDKGDKGDSITLHDVMPFISDEISRQFSTIPKPKNGKDGKSIDKAELLNDLISEARVWFDSIPKPKDGKDGKDGKQGDKGAQGRPGPPIDRRIIEALEKRVEELEHKPT